MPMLGPLAHGAGAVASYLHQHGYGMNQTGFGSTLGPLLRPGNMDEHGGIWENGVPGTRPGNGGFTPYQEGSSPWKWAASQQPQAPQPGNPLGNMMGIALRSLRQPQVMGAPNAGAGMLQALIQRPGGIDAYKQQIQQPPQPQTSPWNALGAQVGQMFANRR